jgi:hypothetical protein
MANKNDILYLFDRPTEPLFVSKGDDNVSFEVPSDYLVSFDFFILLTYLTQM